MYGLKSAPRLWDEWSRALFGRVGLWPTRSSPTLYVNESKTVLASKHVDDVLFVGPSEEVKSVLNALAREVAFKQITELQIGQEVRLLGHLIARTTKGFTLRVAPGVLQSLLVDVGLDQNHAKGTGLPCVKATLNAEDYYDDKTNALLSHEMHAVFRRATGKILYISHSRPDIQFASRLCARAVSAPRASDWQTVKKVTRYLKQTDGAMLTIEASGKPRIDTAVDSDWAGCKLTRRSTNGGAVRYAGACLMSWSRTQAHVAQSSAEAELYAVGSGAAESLALQSLLMELHVEAPIEIQSDSSAGIARLSRAGLGKLRHVQVKHLFVQQLVHDGRLTVAKIDGRLNPADMMTKALDRITLNRHAATVGLTYPCLSLTRPDPQDKQIGRVTMSTNNTMTTTMKAIALLLTTAASQANATMSTEVVTPYEMVPQLPRTQLIVSNFGLTILAMMILTIGIMCGFCLGVPVQQRVSTRRVTRRSIGVQSMTTYMRWTTRPRFQVLPDVSSGAWPEATETVDVPMGGTG